MTIQIGMIGTDGIVLASDTKLQRGQKVRHTNGSTKIRINHEHRLAISCARDMVLAHTIADSIIDHIPDGNWHFPTFPIRDIAKDMRGDGCGQAQCLIVSVKSKPRLFVLDVGTMTGGGTDCSEINDKCVIGDTVNPAVFWSEKYYKPLPISQLASLAAHLIVSAGKLNSATIRGLEMVMCDDSGFRRLAKGSIDELESKANEWDINFGESIYSHTQEFTYTP
ncbi:MAG TPA: hypothetical protein VGN44_18395 [Candidatus Angelobacter sp.]